ncbi:MAG: anti-sigma factor antagonist [Clostridia bacterium]|nr:anti-sigma factor antagonist [Clostridia bacterium]
MKETQTQIPGYRAAAGVAFSTDGSELVARVSGEIDHHAARRLRETIDTEVFRQLPSTLTLDLSGVGFMDSAGLGLILGRLNLMTGRKGVLRLTGLNPPVRRILSLAGVERLPGLLLPEPEPAPPAGVR